MSDSKEEKTYEGWAPTTKTVEELNEVLQKAFEYRGDISLTLEGDQEKVGYLFNRNFKAAEPYVDLYPPSAELRPERVLIKDIEKVVFSGKDTATGNSWEAWVAKQAK